MVKFNDQFRNKRFNATQQQKFQMQVPIEDLAPITCKCGGHYFQPVVELRYASPLQSPNPTGKGSIVQLPVLMCLQCGQVNDVNIPGEEKNEEVEKSPIEIVKK